MVLESDLYHKFTARRWILSPHLSVPMVLLFIAFNMFKDKQK